MGPRPGPGPDRAFWAARRRSGMAKILVADDEHVVRDLIRYGLEQEGHEVLEAGTGPEAINVLKKTRVDLLILDVMLTGMDGYSVQLALAQDPKMQKIPVIVITALQTTKKLFAKFPQVKGFMPKPFDPPELSRLVSEVLSQS
jgi:CheY-like chemotaxis protein